MTVVRLAGLWINRKMEVHHVLNGHSGMLLIQEGENIQMQLSFTKMIKLIYKETR
jgi:hypothetical protein